LNQTEQSNFVGPTDESSSHEKINFDNDDTDRKVTSYSPKRESPQEASSSSTWKQVLQKTNAPSSELNPMISTKIHRNRRKTAKTTKVLVQDD